MKKKAKLIISILVMAFAVLIGAKAVQASYSVEDMDIQATVNQDGSVNIKQKITYQFKGHYNGIYINIPYNLEDAEYEEVIAEEAINNELYNGNNVKINRVSQIANGIEVPFAESQQARNGSVNVYTISKEKGIRKVKAYSPSTNVSKTFQVDYTLENLCVKHNDIGELYYNFIGGAWEVTIKKLNIDIYLPQNQSKIEVWGHGPYNGSSKIINNTHANFKVQDVKPGQYVAARVLFDNSSIPNSTKLSNIDAIDLIHKDENAIIENKEEKNAYTWKIVIFAICLLIYWIILMLVYEKDKKYVVTNIDEEELFKKYNPMLAGCIQGSRTILARDIIAVILGLINKKIIKIDIQNQLKGKDNYVYFVSKNIQQEGQMDHIE